MREEKTDSFQQRTYHRQTQDIMSASAKQERTICVLLPNKEQLDVAVGVGVHGTGLSSRRPLRCSKLSLSLLSFGCTPNILHIVNACSTLTHFFFSPAPAQVHRTGCVQSRGAASRNQRAALLRPHGGEG